MAEFVVTVRPGANIHHVAGELTKMGFAVKDKLEAVGSITGSAQPQDVSRLKAIIGVSDVEESVPIQLPPPGSPIT